MRRGGMTAASTVGDPRCTLARVLCAKRKSTLQAHIQRHYVPFCRESIQSFLAVGFVPVRIRKEGMLLVPEVLPLGTYTWSVNLGEYAKKKRKAGGRMLFYDVTCTYCQDEIHVFNYIEPHATLNCYLPLSSLIPQYSTLMSMRELALNATMLNSKPNVVLEEQEKVMINSIADTGSCITHLANPISQASFESTLGMLLRN